MAVSLGPSCPCWRRPAASPPLKLWRGAGAAQEPPWLKADSPSLPVDCATLLTACCPGSPRSCGRRQRPARADHSSDVGMGFEGTGQLRRTATNRAAASSPPGTLQLLRGRSPHATATFGKDSHWPVEPEAKILYAIVSIHRGQNPPLFASLFSLCRLLQAACPHTFYVSSSNHAVATAGCVLPPMYLGPHSGHCVVRPEYNGFG